MKVGDAFYCTWVDVEEGAVSMELWVVTAIRDGRAFAIHKTDYTWVKRSKTNGDYGWADNISDYDRKRFKLGDGPPANWAKTKSAAYSKALPEIEAAIRKLTKIRAKLTGQRTKVRNAKSGANTLALPRTIGDREDQGSSRADIAVSEDDTPAHQSTGKD